MATLPNDHDERWAHNVANRIYDDEDGAGSNALTRPSIASTLFAPHNMSQQAEASSSTSANAQAMQMQMLSPYVSASSRRQPSPRRHVDVFESQNTFMSRNTADTMDDDVDLEKASDDGKPQQPEEPSKQQEEEKDPNLVDWDYPGLQITKPTELPKWKRWMYTIVLGLATFVVSFASSVFSTTIGVTGEQFGVSSEVMLLGVSLYVCGFATGPIIAGPLSEVYGRKIPLFVLYAIFVIFQIPVAVATNLETIFICRYLGGLAGAAPLSIVGGQLVDLFDPVDRALAVCVYSGAVFVGPATGPIIGGFITQSYLGWRWTIWITMIMAAFFGLVAFVVIPETFAPVLLQREAKRIRYETKNWAIHAKADESRVDFREIVEKYMFRPFKMLLLEPILVAITIYLGFIYGILYLTFEGLPVSFEEERGWNLGVSALPFLGILIGVVLGCTILALHTHYRFRPIYEREGHVVPEERLPPMILGGILLPIGLFWFAWTSNVHINPAPSIISIIPIGMGIQLIFQQGLNYIIDVYMMYANSAIAANTIVRSLMAAGFPMFAPAMFHNLGVDWAASLLGFLSLALLPFPILFYYYGERVRKLSKFSPT